MQLHILALGFLKARATEMIKPLSQKEIGLRYEIDMGGYLRLNLNALLIVEGDRVILMDPGCADFLPSRILREYGLEISEPIENLLVQKGLSVELVTDVIFTHLHFDHGSGAFKRVPGNIVKRFPNARYHVLKEHYDYALKPDPFESNSFFTGFFKYLDHICWLEDWEEDWLEFRFYNGHTRGMTLPLIRPGNEVIAYLTDLIPMQIFLDYPVNSGYDLDPGLALLEKQNFLQSIAGRTKFIFFHDPLKDSTYYP